MLLDTCGAPYCTAMQVPVLHCNAGANGDSGVASCGRCDATERAVHPVNSRKRCRSFSTRRLAASHRVSEIILYGQCHRSYRGTVATVLEYLYIHNYAHPHTTPRLPDYCV
jgi:hypothetical protein